MDYFILKTVEGHYYCVNHVTRGKNSIGEDTIQFLCSGILNQMPITRVVGIFPQTPVPGTVL